MTIKLDLHSRAQRSAVLVAALLCAAVFIALATTRFVASALADPRIQADPETIEAAADHFPNSAPLQARMAARLIESGVEETRSHERTAERAIHYASRAVSLAPWNYEFRILLAAAREMNGNLTEAETDLRAALALAPQHASVRWRLANLLAREGKLDQAVGDFRAVAEADPGRLTAALSMVWQASDGDVEALSAVAGDAPKLQLALAQFLFQQERADAAVKIVRRLGRQAFLGLPEGNQFLDSLISAGHVELAGELWRDLFSDGLNDGRPLVWNGGFETLLREGFTQFDWNLGQSKYARIAITPGNAWTGQRSLRIAYQGLNTTMLDGEVHQLVLARPGARYRLTYYAKAENLVTPDGPQVVVTAHDSGTPVAASSALAAGSYDWRPLAINFVAPSGARGLIVSVKQTPQFSYVEPTKGTVWFDDFVLTEEQSGGARFRDKRPSVVVR